MQLAVIFVKTEKGQLKKERQYLLVERLRTDNGYIPKSCMAFIEISLAALFADRGIFFSTKTWKFTLPETGNSNVSRKMLYN